MQNFIEKNKQFWKNYRHNKPEQMLLVEKPSDALFITHCMAMQTIILNNGCGYTPLFIRNENIPIELLQSYVPNAKYIDLPKLNLLHFIYIFILLIKKFFEILLNQEILSFTFDNVKYGDLVYDEYLCRKKIASIKKIDTLVIKLMYEVAKKHLSYKMAIKKYNIVAVLTSHKIGLDAGTLVRSGIISDCNVYTNYGMHKNTLMLSKGLDEMIEFGYTPTKKDIEKLITLDEDLFNQKFEEIRHEHIYGNINTDAIYAFADDNTFFEDRNSFCGKYNLNANKKNIFIMLHAFTDYPHSHFDRMLFNDYGDWFLKTLEFAKQDKNVNWIFKQHPSDKFYPTKDIVFSKIFKNIPENVLFLSSTEKLDTRSLGNIADAVITCAGSAGFEVPAFFGIPSITAGDNFYQGFDFLIKPETKNEYFNILKNLKNIQPLSKDAHKQARAVYMFICRVSVVLYSFIPVLSLEDHNSPSLNNIFFDKVLKLYSSNEEQIHKEIEKYSFELSKEDFKALRTCI